MGECYILGDWGTSSARFYLCRDRAVLDSVNGPGIKFTTDAADVFLKTINPWLEAHGPLPSMLCGMVGSNIGWQEAGYIECPANADRLLEKKIAFSSPGGDITIIPGVKTKKGLTGLPDMMRGEEVQILGWASKHGNDGLLCLPGTHTKWAYFKDGKIDNFVSSLNGELFNILATHSVLISDISLHPPEINASFHRGLDIGASGESLNQLLFSVRSRQLNGDDGQESAQSYLLGLLIGSDVSSGFKFADGAVISVIGGEGPAKFYAEAIRHLGGKADVYDGQEESIAGLGHLYESAVLL